ncbi:MAG: trypsin-like peptidase domain-containing protein [Bacillota bacterium]
MRGWRAVAGLVLALVLWAPPAARAAPEPEMDITALVEQVRPSVVGILVSVRSDDPSRPGEDHAAGTGFVYREGVILTNAHVVRDAVEVQILWSDGTVVPVPEVEKNVRWDEAADIGIVRVETRGRPPLPLGDSDALKVGQPVIAIGNPLGFRLGNTVTRGILSGTGRAVGTGLPFLQHDAPINPGNSGGPLLDARGRVIGINSAKVTDIGVEGLSLAIPINLAREVADELLARGKVDRVWLGLALQEDWRGYFGVPNAEGVEIVAIVPDGPAGVAGLQVGDRVIRIDDRPVGTQDDVHAYLLTRRPGDQVTLTVRRQGQVLQSRITLEARDAVREEALARDARAPGGIWLQLTPSQVREAAEYGEVLAFQGLEAMTFRYAARSGSARAVLYTEFGYIARRVASAYWATGRRPSDAFAQGVAEGIRGQLEVVVEATGPGDGFFSGARVVLRQGDRQVAGTLERAGYAVALDGGSATGQAVFRFPSAGLDPSAPIDILLRLSDGQELRFHYELKELR